MSTCPLLLTGPARIYRFLLWLYPPCFRRRFGAEMLLVFHDSCRERIGSAPNRLDFSILTLRDLAWSLPGEWWQALAKPGRLELPIGQWADSLVIPFTVLGYVTVEGALGGALVRASAVLAWAQGCAVALTLVVLGILISQVTARTSRTELWSIKL
jgi:hypothetical protein